MNELPSGRWWIALVTFERDREDQDTLPDWAWGAVGWMFTSGEDEEEAYGYLERAVKFHGLRVVEIDEMREVFGPEDIDEIDEHLAMNVREFESGHRTAWGTIHGYKGEGEA